MSILLRMLLIVLNVHYFDSPKSIDIKTNNINVIQHLKHKILNTRNAQNELPLQMNGNLLRSETSETICNEDSRHLFKLLMPKRTNNY